MKEIILIRHAKVDIDSSEPIFSSQMRAWVARYDHAPVDVGSMPSEETLEAIRGSDILLTSTLPRAIASAAMTGRDVYASKACFNEAVVPDFSIPFVKLSPRRWLLVLRLLLLAGLGKKDESLKVSKARAKEAASQLLTYVQTHERIVLIGHGGMNWLIKKELMQQGWQLSGDPSHKNWGMTRLVLPYKEP